MDVFPGRDEGARTNVDFTARPPTVDQSRVPQAPGLPRDAKDTCVNSAPGACQVWHDWLPVAHSILVKGT